MRGDTGGEHLGPGAAADIPATLVISSEETGQWSVPVYDWLVVGRECRGIDDRHRLLIADRAVSRVHLEVRLDLEQDEAWLTDHSTNGTRLNGQRIARSLSVRLSPGDRIRLGAAELEFRSRRFAAAPDTSQPRDPTIREITVAQMVMVVGDVVGFSTIAERTDDRVLLENIDRLYAGLRPILARHNGTLNNYVGDAFFATWEADPVSAAARAAVGFAVEAAETLPRIAAGLDLRDPSGGLVRMGWGVASGPAAVSQLTGVMLVTVLGDATNVAFRLSGIAGREGRPDVLVTGAVFRAAAAGFSFTPPTAIRVKGRDQAVEALGASRL